MHRGGGSPYNGGIIQDHYPLYTAPIIDISIIQHGSRDIIFIQPRETILTPPSVGRDRSRYDQFINCPHNMLLLLGPYCFVSVFVFQTPGVDKRLFFALVADIFFGISKTKRQDSNGKVMFDRVCCF